MAFQGVSILGVHERLHVHAFLLVVKKVRTTRAYFGGLNSCQYYLGVPYDKYSMIMGPENIVETDGRKQRSIRQQEFDPQCRVSSSKISKLQFF